MNKRSKIVKLLFIIINYYNSGLDIIKMKFNINFIKSFSYFVNISYLNIENKLLFFVIFIIIIIGNNLISYKYLY